jgi:cysteine desulfuration protein SufE
MFESCERKQQALRDLFSACLDADARYQKIIELGKEQPKLDPSYKIPENIVNGCQSVVYLHSELKDGSVIFEAESDALISAGLAALLVRVYSGESPEVILKCPPKFLEDLGITASLTPNRANGLYSVHLRMKQDALKLLLKNNHKNA